MAARGGARRRRRRRLRRRRARPLHAGRARAVDDVAALLVARGLRCSDVGIVAIGERGIVEAAHRLAQTATATGARCASPRSTPRRRTRSGTCAPPRRSSRRRRPARVRVHGVRRPAQPLEARATFARPSAGSAAACSSTRGTSSAAASRRRALSPSRRPDRARPRQRRRARERHRPSLRGPLPPAAAGRRDLRDRPVRRGDRRSRLRRADQCRGALDRAAAPPPAEAARSSTGPLPGHDGARSIGGDTHDLGPRYVRRCHARPT